MLSILDQSSEANFCNLAYGISLIEDNTRYLDFHLISKKSLTGLAADLALQFTKLDL